MTDRTRPFVIKAHCISEMAKNKMSQKEHIYFNTNSFRKIKYCSEIAGGKYLTLKQSRRATHL